MKILHSPELFSKMSIIYKNGNPGFSGENGEYIQPKTISEIIRILHIQEKTKLANKFSACIAGNDNLEIDDYKTLVEYLRLLPDYILETNIYKKFDEMSHLNSATFEQQITNYDNRELHALVTSQPKGCLFSGYHVKTSDLKNLSIGNTINHSWEDKVIILCKKSVAIARPYYEISEFAEMIVDIAERY